MDGCKVGVAVRLPLRVRSRSEILEKPADRCPRRDRAMAICRSRSSARAAASMVDLSSGSSGSSPLSSSSGMERDVVLTAIFARRSASARAILVLSPTSQAAIRLSRSLPLARPADTHIPPSSLHSSSPLSLAMNPKRLTRSRTKCSRFV